jgi:CDP-ribitol ribitolphosphotransferase
MLLTIRIWSIRLIHGIARRLPRRRGVVLATAHASRIGGNLAVIRDELARRTPPIPVTVLADRPRRGWRGRLASLWQGLVGAYHLGRAAVFVVDDYYFPIYPVRPRAGTRIVQTWHACGAFKKFGYSVLDKSFGADASLTDKVRIHGNYDICIVGSRTAAIHYSEAFHQPLDRFVTDLGVPRTDVLFGEERLARSAAALRTRYAIPSDKRVVLYAPTFRGDSVTTARFGDGLDLGAMRRVLGEDHVVLVRLHPFIRSAAPIDPAIAASGFAIDVSDHPDINELLPLSDVLVTDYSSVIFEYSLLHRPMLFFAPDVDAYDDERGFYFDYRTGVPGPVFETTEALAEHLRAGVFDLARVEAFRATAFEVADGHATERFVDHIVVPALAR